MNAATSDEFMNDPDAETSVVSEDSSDGPVGIPSTALYDCHPSECARMIPCVSFGDGMACDSFGGTD